MLKDLFQNRLFIGALAFFVFCVGGSLLYMQHVERQTARESAAHEAHIKALTEKEQPKPTAEVETPQQDEDFHVSQPPETPIESPPVVQSKPDVSAPVGSAYRPFNDPYQRMVDGFTVTSNYAMMLAPPGVGPDWASMSAEELADAIAAISNNAHPPEHLRPPEGYKYPHGGTIALSNGGGLWLDDNGYPILRKRNTPYFEIHWTEGFRPPPDVYADYKALYKRFLIGPSAEKDQVSAEMDAMKAMYVGRIPAGPFTGLGGVRPHDMDIREYLPIFRQQFGEVQTQLKRTAYESEGIDYLMDQYSDLKPYANLHRYPELKEYVK